jgi:hypothetical protein
VPDDVFDARDGVACVLEGFPCMLEVFLGLLKVLLNVGADAFRDPTLPSQH